MRNLDKYKQKKGQPEQNGTINYKKPGICVFWSTSWEV